MGWLYPYECTTKKSLVDYVMASWKDDNVIHATKSVGKGLWVLATPKGHTTPFIFFYHMQLASG